MDCASCNANWRLCPALTGFPGFLHHVHDVCPSFLPRASTRRTRLLSCTRTRFTRSLTVQRHTLEDYKEAGRDLGRIMSTNVNKCKVTTSKEFALSKCVMPQFLASPITLSRCPSVNSENETRHRHGKLLISSSSHPKYQQIPPDTTKYHQIPTNINKYQQIPPAPPPCSNC